MNKAEKLKAKLLAGQGYHNFSFDDLVMLLESLGFTMRQRGSHHWFTLPNIADAINIQPRNGQCKPYQLRQVRDFIKTHNL
jgi:predicted RNA binding protein YcfA (HicA-like mRNA interferase family)